MFAVELTASDLESLRKSELHLNIFISPGLSASATAAFIKVAASFCLFHELGKQNALTFNIHLPNVYWALKSEQQRIKMDCSYWTSTL